MKIESSEFVKSVVDLSHLPKLQLPEVAFVGRSNVGKSRLLNVLVNRKKLAAISSKPGKTKVINFFKINNKYYFVDLPGYGFAKVSTQMRHAWKELVEAYLSSSQNLRVVVVITDVRHKITKLDMQMLSWLYSKKIPCIVVATKADKLSNNQLSIQMNQNHKLIKQFGIDDILSFSAITGFGKKNVLDEINKFIVAKI